MWAMSIAASRMGTDALAAHHVCILTWMFTSYLIDGFADVGLMLGAKMLGGGQVQAFKRLSLRLTMMGLATGAVCAGTSTLDLICKYIECKFCLMGGVMVSCKNIIIVALLDKTSKETYSLLHQLWPLLTVMQVPTNSTRLSQPITSNMVFVCS